MSRVIPVEFVGGGPLDGERLEVTPGISAVEHWFVDDTGIARRGLYEIDRAAKPVLMRWAGYGEDVPLRDPTQVAVKVPGIREPIAVEYEREIAEWVEGFSRYDVEIGELFMRHVRVRVIAAVADFSAMTNYDEVAGPEAEVLLRAQIVRQAREEIVPVTYIALLAQYANQSENVARRSLRMRAIQYLRLHPAHATRMRADELLAVMGPSRRWVEGVLSEAAKSK